MVRPIIKNKFFIFFSIFLYCLVILGCNDTSKHGIIIKDAHLYLPLKGTDMSAGYLRLENNQIKKIVISSIECEKAEASIHETILNSVLGKGNPALPRIFLQVLRQLTTGLVSVSPYPTKSSIPNASKKLSTCDAIAPPPLIGKRSCPPQS